MGFSVSSVNLATTSRGVAHLNPGPHIWDGRQGERFGVALLRRAFVVAGAGYVVAEMASLGEIIRSHHAQILQLWTNQAHRTAAARGLDRPEFQNLIPTFLSSLAAAGTELGRFVSVRREQVEGHLSSRVRQGFQLAEIVEEFALLGR